MACDSNTAFACEVLSYLKLILDELDEQGSLAGGDSDSAQLLCDPNTGARVIVRYTFNEDGSVATTTAFTLSGAAYGGSVNALISCPEATALPVEYFICDAGIQKIARVCFNGCGPTAVSFFTIDRVATTAPSDWGLVTAGICGSANFGYDTLLLCSDNGSDTTQFIRHFIKNADGTVTVVNTLLNGITAFNPNSSSLCTPGLAQVLVLCDNGTPFLRHVLRNQYNRVSTYDTTLSGTVSYTAVGVVGNCSKLPVLLELGCLTSGGVPRQVQIVKMLDANGGIASHSVWEATGVLITPAPGEILTVGPCFCAAKIGTGTTLTEIGSGLIAAGKASIAIANVGAVAGVVDSQPILPGESRFMAAYEDPVTKQFVRLRQITYDGTGTFLRIDVQD